MNTDVGVGNDVLDGKLVSDYARSYRSHPRWPLIKACKGISMLHSETLALLWYFSNQASGAVLEIGPYIGGSTIMMGSACKANGRKIITIEPGGAHPTHPHIPTNDILGDLKRNLREFAVADAVTLLEGTSYDPAIVQQVKELVGDGTVDLLFIDADGEVGRDIAIYQPLLSHDCIIILDDYESELAHDKEIGVRRWVDQALKDGIASQLAIVQWGTWVGRYHKRDSQPER